MEPTEFIDVRSCLRGLELSLPDGIVVLPYNLDDASDASELTYAGLSSAVLKLFRTTEGLDAAPITEEPLPMRRDRDVTIDLPILFFAATYLSRNPHAISVVLNVIGNYATQMMQGIPGAGKVKLSVAVEATKTKRATKIDYDGPPSGLHEVAKIAETIHGKEQA